MNPFKTRKNLRALTFCGALPLFAVSSFSCQAQNETAANVAVEKVAPAPNAAVQTYKAKSAQEVNEMSKKLKPGDTLILRDGEWMDKGIKIKAQGSEAQPITVRAATPGQVIFGGTSKIEVDGEYIVLSGVMFKDTAAGGDTISIKGDHCRLTQSAVVGGTSKNFVHLRGTNSRVDHCYLAGKTSDSPTLQVEVDEQPNNHLLEFNHFGPRAPLGKNGGETIRTGYSQDSMKNSRTTVQNNLFDRCDGEIEVISNKSGENFYRGNTFYECAGMLTLRHGNRCVVDGNFFIGHNKEGSGGVRIIGEDHVVTNNYVEGATRGGFWLTAGVPDSPLNKYFRARNVVLAFNTVVDSSGPYIDLDNGFGTSDRTLRPENITIANNLLVGPKSAKIIDGEAGAGFQWMGNIASAETKNAPAQGLRIVADLQLTRAKNGIMRPTADSAVKGAAQGDGTAVKTDIDGQARAPKADVGCDQISDAPVTNQILTAAETGPTWMKR